MSTTPLPEDPTGANADTAPTDVAGLAFAARTAALLPRIRGLFWLAVAVLAVMSLLPGERLPAFTASIWDKAQHAGGFALLAVLGLWAYAGGGWGRRAETWRVLMGLMAFGIAIEFAQAATGWRHGDAADAVADAVGLVLGWGLARALELLRNRPKARQGAR